MEAKKAVVALCDEFNFNNLIKPTGRCRQQHYSQSTRFSSIIWILLLAIPHVIYSFSVGPCGLRPAHISTVERKRFALALSLSSSSSRHVSVKVNGTDDSNKSVVDQRPFELRTTGPRTARRMNHGFRYLYRHDPSIDIQVLNNMTSFEYLRGYYKDDEVIYQMNATFPPLLDLNVSRHVHPKMRFLHETMGLRDIATDSNQILQQIPPQYFGARLERIIAPRHAFLVYHHLPHGKQLLEKPEMWNEFLISCRTTKRFCALCNQWQRKYPSSHLHSSSSGSSGSMPTMTVATKFTATQIEAFDTLFGRGILAATRGELCQTGNEWPLKHINITSADLVALNLQHGANPLERDNRGSSLLHWAAGTGNLSALKVLLPHFPKGILELTERDGATPLHWAAAGANSKEFGTGGHVDICRYLLSQCNEPTSTITTKEFVNQLTKDENSPLMWASWSGTLDTVKLLVRTRADYQVANRNGCTVAHWAASGGNLEVCKYLADVVGVDFFVSNFGGNTPLTHAVAFGRVDIVQWLRERATAKGNDDEIAAALAEDFCVWTEGDERRKQILSLFQDNYWDSDASRNNENGFEDQSIDMVHELELENNYNA